MTPDEIIVRGERAKNVATNPDYIHLLNDVASDVFNQFRKTNISDNEKREELHKVVFALDLLGKKFEKYQTEAKVELDKFIAAQAEKDK